MLIQHIKSKDGAWFATQPAAAEYVMSQAAMQ
jgi:hypothetical protein